MLLAIAALLGDRSTVRRVATTSTARRPSTRARDIGASSLLVTAGIIDQLIGPLALAAGLFLISLNAMRVGLLTRFLGILGIIAGVLTVAPQLMPLPVIQSFWLISLGLLLLGAAPGGAPPAWSTGNAEPWPSQRRCGAGTGAARAHRADQRRRRRRGVLAPAHPSSKKRKRKRRG